MVCKVGHGRMAAIVRFLASEQYGDAGAEETDIAKSIQQQFQSVSEANLLEEKDKHIFGSTPLKDPLHIVCCNACKKPIKASHIAEHAERCKMTSFEEDNSMEFADNGHKKPPRKGRRNLQTASNDQSTAVMEEDRGESMDGGGVSCSELNLESQSSMHSSLSGETKGTEVSVVQTRVRDTSESSVAVPYISADFPIPLATKIYHLHGTNRLRMALSYLYYGASLNQDDSDSCVEVTKDTATQSSQVSALGGLLHDGFENVTESESMIHGSEPHSMTFQDSALAVSLPYQFQGNSFGEPNLPTDVSNGMTRNSYLVGQYESQVTH